MCKRDGKCFHALPSVIVGKKWKPDMGCHERSPLSSARPFHFWPSENLLDCNFSGCRGNTFPAAGEAPQLAPKRNSNRFPRGAARAAGVPQCGEGLLAGLLRRRDPVKYKWKCRKSQEITFVKNENRFSKMENRFFPAAQAISPIRTSAGPPGNK